jgi:hypothetical protein
MTVKIPDKKMKELLVLIREVAFSKKVKRAIVEMLLLFPFLQ